MSRLGSYTIPAAVCAAALVALAGGRGSAGQGNKPAPGKHSSGRALPPMPEVKRAVMFNTPEADAVLAALQVFPADNPWNEDVSRLLSSGPDGLLEEVAA